MSDPVELVPFDSRYGRTLARMGGPVDQRLPNLHEQRDPTAATRPLRFTTPDMAQIDEWDAETAIRFGYLANVIAYRCVQIIAGAIAALPFRAGLDPTKPMEFDVNAPLARLLGPAPGGPAPKLAAAKLWAWTIAQRLVTGRNAWELEWDGDRLVAIWPLTSANLRAIPTTQGSEWFKAFEYGRRDQPRRLTADQVFYGWDPSLLDFRQPESALQAARYDLSVAVMSDRYSHAFLKNGAVPAALVVTQEFPDPKARGRFRQQFGARHQGPDNAGGVGFVEVRPDGAGGEVGKSFDVKVLGLPQKDAQFIEQHKHALEMVAIDLGVPWSKLDASGRTYDNATQEDATFWNERLLGIIRTIQDEVNMDLAPRVGREVGWFDLSGVAALKVKPEPATNPVGAPEMVQAQLMKIDEARADYGLPPLPNGAGDRFFTADEILAVKAPTPAPAQRSADAGTPPAPTVATTPTPDTRALGAPLETRAPTADETEARRAKIWKRTNAAAVTLERQWERTFRRLFSRQETATLGRLTGKRGRQAERRESIDPSSIFDRTFWVDQTSDLAADLYDGIASAAAARVSEAFGIDFDLQDPAVAEFIQARANQLAGQVTDTTYEQITSQLAEGAAAGEDTVELAARVRRVFEEASKNRSVVIARTEVVSAFNGSTAQLAALMPDDVVAGQEWIATRDGRTRKAHASADGQVRLIGQPFDVGGSALMYPGDPNGPADETIQCRCALALLTPEDMADLAADRSRPVPLELARAIVAMAAAGRFDEAETRARLRCAA
jgi:HK97 family phage portal protein